MIEIGTGQTERAAIAGENDHGVPAEIFAAFIAARLPVGNENAQVPRGVTRCGALRRDR